MKSKDEGAMMIAQSLSGLSRGSFVRAFTRLQNVCSRLRRIVMPHQRSLPRLHLDGNICSGYNRVMSLIRKYGKGSAVVIELKDIIYSKKWTQAWVQLVFTGFRWWFYIQQLFYYGQSNAFRLTFYQVHSVN